MLKIGSHISSAKGFEAMGKTAVRLNATAFAFFTRNPRGGKAKAIDEEDVKRFHVRRMPSILKAGLQYFFTGFIVSASCSIPCKL